MLKQIFKNYKQKKEIEKKNQFVIKIQNEMKSPEEYKLELKEYHFTKLIYGFDFSITSVLYSDIIKQLEAVGICCNAFQLWDRAFIKIGTVMYINYEVGNFVGENFTFDPMRGWFFHINKYLYNIPDSMFDPELYEKEMKVMAIIHNKMKAFFLKMEEMTNLMVKDVDIAIKNILHKYLNNHKDKYVLQFSNLDPVIDDIKNDLENKLKTM